jgi:hypothetical protein
MADVMMFAVAAIGMALHWFKRWAAGQTDTGFWRYFFVVETKRSLAALATMVIAVATFLSTFDGHLSTSAFYTALLTGYASDSAANSG